MDLEVGVRVHRLLVLLKPPVVEELLVALFATESLHFVLETVLLSRRLFGVNFVGLVFVVGVLLVLQSLEQGIVRLVQGGRRSEA